MIIDCPINLPGFVCADLQRTATAAGDRPSDDALDREVTQQCSGLRRVFDTVERNGNIARRRLSADHGSFAGWCVSTPPDVAMEARRGA